MTDPKIPPKTATPAVTPMTVELAAIAFIGCVLGVVDEEGVEVVVDVVEDVEVNVAVEEEE